MVTWLVFSTFASAIVCDLVIALSICYLLGRAQTGRQIMDRVLQMLGLYFVKSGLVITGCNTACIISFAVLSRNCLFMAIFHFSFSFYFLSLLSILTSRDDLRARMGGVVTALPLCSGSPSSTSVFARQASKEGTFTLPNTIQVSIVVETETDFSADETAKDGQNDSVNVLA